MRDLSSYQADELVIHDIALRGFGGTKLPVVLTPDQRLWWPVRAICEKVFGIDASAQIARLKADEDTSHLLDKMIVTTKTAGKRQTTLLEFKGLAVWFTKLQTGSMANQEVKEKVRKFKGFAFRVFNSILLDPGQYSAEEFEALAESFWDDGPTEIEQLNIHGLNRNVALLEHRQAHVEDVLFGQSYVNERELDESGAGILNVPFTVTRPGKYVLRLRQVPFAALEIIGVLPAD